jgi:hypothetical protein
MAHDPLTSLRSTVRALASFAVPSGPIQQLWLDQLPIVRGKLSVVGQIVGVKQEAGDDLYDLADAIFRRNPAYQRGATFGEILSVVSGAVIENFFGREANTIVAGDLALVEKRVSDWFAEMSADRRMFIACNIIPYPAKPFSIGSVSFRHVEEFLNTQRTHHGQFFDTVFRPVIDAMIAEGAIWVADVSVPDCIEKRGEELADLSVDLAMAGLQLVVPLEFSQRMSRLNARTLPPFRASVSVINGQLSSSHTSQYAGFGIAAETFDRWRQTGSSLLPSVGRRVDEFLTGKATLPRLSQAWCDAAYWFHEGVAEPLDTIAVPKLETVVEILFRSESTSGSESRMIRAIKTFYGLESDQPIGPSSQTTVKAFAKGFVRDRSRILHGTWSTLWSHLRDSRPSLALLAKGLLANFTVELDAYAGEMTAKDDTQSFLDWVENHRATSNGKPAAVVAPPK